MTYVNRRKSKFFFLVIFQSKAIKKNSYPTAAHAVVWKTKQVEIRDLTKYGSNAVIRGWGIRFEDTTSPVDPGDKGKVAEAVDVCFPDEVRCGQR